jgi:hypothetical protein
MNFDGKLEAYFDPIEDPSCHKLNPTPQSIDVKLEICGNEKIDVRGGSAPIRYEYDIGIDDPEKLKIDSLFKVNSQSCGIAGYDIVIRKGREEFPISPNLRSIFRYNNLDKTLQLANVKSQTWNNREVRVWIKAFTKGGVAEYKEVAIKFSGNSAPAIRGDVGPWDIVVNEVDDNAGQTQEFNLEFADPDGDRITSYEISQGFYS